MQVWTCVHWRLSRLSCIRMLLTAAATTWQRLFRLWRTAPWRCLRWPYILLTELFGGALESARAVLGCSPIGANEHIAGLDGSASGEGTDDPP